MAESERDELADALARMAGGEVPSEHEPEVPAVPPAVPVRPVARPVARAVRPGMSRPAAPAAGTPAVPQPPRPVAPRPSPPAAPIEALAESPAPAMPRRPVQPAPLPTERIAIPPAQPARPSSPPVIRPATPVLRRPRPAAPSIAAPVEPTEFVPDEFDIDGGQSTGITGAADITGTADPDASAIIDDDDSVIVPAPDTSVFTPRPKIRSSAETRARAAARRSLEFRRTLIPILLTCAVVMLGFASLKFIVGPDSTLTLTPTWAPVLLAAAAGILLALAVVNMISVKANMHALKEP